MSPFRYIYRRLKSKLFTLMRYGELTNDEFFVSEGAAKKGVVITNTSKTEPIVMLKHFAENPELIRFMEENK